MPSDPSDTERRIIALERSTRIVRAGARDVAALIGENEQNLGRIRNTSSASSCAGVTVFPAYSACIPFNVPYVLTFFTALGSGTTVAASRTLAWQGSGPGDATGVWTDCFHYGRPNSFGCSYTGGFGDIPIFVTLSLVGGTCLFRVEIIKSGSCPTTGHTCADRSSVNYTVDIFPAAFTSASDVFSAGQSPALTDSLILGPTSTQPTLFVNAFNVARADSVWFPDTLNLSDAAFGNTTLAWKGESWKGCIDGISYASFGSCASKTIGVHYELSTGGDLVVSWLLTGSCPQTSACSGGGVSTAQILGHDDPNSDFADGVLAYRFTGGAGGTALRNLYHDTTTGVVVSIP